MLITQTKLSDVLKKVGDGMQYEYDMGDSWIHILELKEISEASSLAEAKKVELLEA